MVDFRLLLDPVSSVGPQRPALPPPYPTIPAPAVPTVPAEGPADVLAGLKAKSSRFAGLTVTLANGVATVSGSAADPAAAWDAAAAIRAAAGVERVVVGELR
ncbi:MAG: BON domain-containing protein [Gemmataceae bacterium]